MRSLGDRGVSSAKVGMKSEAANGGLTQRAQRHGGRRAGDEFPPGDDTREVGRVWFVRINRYWRVPRLGVLFFLEATRNTFGSRSDARTAYALLRERYIYFNASVKRPIEVQERQRAYGWLDVTCNAFTFG